ncbi:hypothetical protein C8C99_0337 [Acidovorax sp. 107]|uniref:hypothetical protein n=1 Tax=Acidovorax sp. 107 TaxID=2135638 RepID=UPI000D3549D2|nr:hypothetical protein [Acidovorax sp. 107]PUA95537.1 hypothetical protein C8C99_0337 [Acidovorax sp. 107]
MINHEQLDGLRSIFETADDDWLLEKFSIVPAGTRGFVLTIDKISSQEFEQIFPGVKPWEIGKSPAAWDRDGEAPVLGPNLGAPFKDEA